MMDKYCHAFFQFFGSTIAFELYITTYSVRRDLGCRNFRHQTVQKFARTGENPYLLSV